MKHMILAVALLVIPAALSLRFSGLYAQAPLVELHKTAITWKVTEVTLGEIPQGKPVTITFEFKNTGETPILISNVQASCGCTNTDYNRNPILPGETTKISATYNAAAKGVFKKSVTVTTNAEQEPKVLEFHGTVL